MTSFSFAIRTPDGTLLSREVQSVKLATEAGVTSVLAHHADLLASVAFTHVIVKYDHHIDEYLVRGGILVMDHDANTLSLLVSFAEELSESTSVTAQEYLHMLAKEMEEGHTLSSFHLDYLQEEHFVLTKQMETLQKP